MDKHRQARAPGRQELNTQWVVLSGLKRHGFPGDAAVVNLLVQDGALPRHPARDHSICDGEEQSDPVSRLGNLRMPGPPGSRYAPPRSDLRDRVALLNRILIVDPNQADALTVLTRDLYAVILREAMVAHKLTVKDPSLAMAVNEQYWNVYAQGERLDLSLDMEMGAG